MQPSITITNGNLLTGKTYLLKYIRFNSKEVEKVNIKTCAIKQGNILFQDINSTANAFWLPLKELSFYNKGVETLLVNARYCKKPGIFWSQLKDLLPYKERVLLTLDNGY